MPEITVSGIFKGFFRYFPDNFQRLLISEGNADNLRQRVPNPLLYQISGLYDVQLVFLIGSVGNQIKPRQKTSSVHLMPNLSLSSFSSFSDLKIFIPVRHEFITLRFKKTGVLPQLCGQLPLF